MYAGLRASLSHRRFKTFSILSDWFSMTGLPQPSGCRVSSSMNMLRLS